MAKKQTGYFKRAVPSIDRTTCNDCGLCADVCGGEPLVVVNGRVEIDPEPALGCFGCGLCMMICPTRSIAVNGRDLSPKDILDLPPKSGRATADQLEALLLPRRSIRRFKEKEVDRAVVDRVIRIASTAPMGIPPSEVGILVVHGRDKVKAFSADVMSTVERTMKMVNPLTMALFRPFTKKATYDSFKEFVIPIGDLMAKEKESGGDPLLYGASVALLFHSSPYADPADCYIAATYAMIAAESLGLGTCMIGMVAPFLGRNKKLMAKYGIPKDNKPIIVLLMGYPGTSFKHGVRRRFASVSYNGEPRAD
ncbi:MAG: nitroreductase family protein [Candidatus Thermoplasmatota archaeon]|nr:nitroreductase family protein [Candidatus Thermoplasmatota archaeon]